MLQRQILFKQLQEMQQRQQLQELSDARQQNYANQLSYLNKQTSVGLHPPLVNGMPIHDASQMFMVGNMHLAQRGASPIIQGVPNELVFSQAQNQAVASTGVLPQQIDASLYGTPIASSGNNMYQYSSIQGSAHNSANMLNSGNNNQVEIPVMQPSSVSNSFLNDQFNASPHKDSMSGGTFTSKSVVEDKNFFGQLLMQASDDGVLPANLQQLHFLQRNTAMKESDMRKEQDGWSAFSAGVTSKLNPSQGATSLDPLEEKILFNTDDDSWESSLGRQSNVGRVGFESTGVDFMGSFSSTQSGSWSALMQSAVAETSSSDTGQQEEWSGLSFQNPELSADFQHTNYIVDGKQSSWVDNNLQSISSPTSKAKILFQNSNTNYSFPTFQQSSHHVARQKEGMNSDPSLEFIQQSPKSASKWFDCNPHQKQPVEGCQSVQEPSLLQNIWHDQRLDPSKNDRRQTSLSRYTMGSQPGNNLTGHELKENVWMHESGPQPMVGGSQRPPEQTTHAWSNQEVGYVDNVANVRMSSKKVHSPDMQNSRASEEMPPRNNVDSLAALFDSSADFCSQSITSHAGENMLDLLNKADKSVEIRTGIHLGSRGSVPLSQEPQIQNCDNHLYYNSSVSQGFGLRLAPPSQQMPKSYSSPSSQLLGNSSVTNASGPLYLNNQLNNQYQPVAPAASQSPNAALLSVTGRYQAGVPASNIFQANLQDQKFPTLETLPVNQPSLISGVPHQIGISMGPPTMSQEHVLPSDVPMPNVFSNLLPSQDSINSNVDTATGTTQGFDYEDHHMDELNSSEVSPTSSHYQLIRGHEAVAKHLAGQNATTSVSMITATHHQALNTVEQRENNSPDMPERDLAALGRPLRPHRLQQKISLLHQVNNLNNFETDSINKMLVRYKEGDSILNFQQVLANKRRQLIYGLKSGVINLAQDDPNAKVQLNSISTGDNKPMTYSSEASGDQDSGMLVFGKNDTHFHSKEQSQINAQVAPSWFKHCGTMKNGQMLPMYDLMLTKDAARQFSIGKSFEDFQVIGSIGQVNSSNANRLSGILPNSASKEVTATELTPPLLFPLDDNERNLAVLRPKKRKVAAFDSLPWHKEVTQGSQLLEKVGSMAESEWVLASNRLSERVEDEAETMEYVFPMSRAKKRLVLATQLMQQVLRPAPTVILSADTCSNSESIVYFVARSALGDACRLTCDFHKPSLTSDKSSEDLIASERVGQLGFSKVAENFVDRAKRLENDFLRMDKTASIVDIKVDSQELEKFSVINRFAVYHSRGYNVSVNASSTSGANPAVIRTFPQKYVVAHAMPKVVSEGISCISL